MGDDLVFSICMACQMGYARGACYRSLRSPLTTVANRRLPLPVCISYQRISKKYTKHSKSLITFVSS
jgi:hypothetical protein